MNDLISSSYSVPDFSKVPSGPVYPTSGSNSGDIHSVLIEVAIALGTAVGTAVIDAIATRARENKVQIETKSRKNDLGVKVLSVPEKKIYGVDMRFVSYPKDLEADEVEAALRAQSEKDQES